MTRVKRQSLLKLTSGNKQEIRTQQLFLLRLQIDDLGVRVWFGVADNLAVDVSIEKSVIGRFTRGISPAERELIPRNSQLSAILPPQRCPGRSANASDKPSKT